MSCDDDKRFYWSMYALMAFIVVGDACVLTLDALRVF